MSDEPEMATIPPQAPLPALATGDLPGTGGRTRSVDADFVVEEIPLYGPTGEGQHTLFAVEKRGISTMEAMRRIANALGVATRLVSSAGLKDAHAIARQTLSVEGVDPERLLALELDGVDVLWADRHRNRLKIGHLRGNRFRIRIRGVGPDGAARAQAILDRLVARGVPNGYGPQRFGTRATTHLLGRAMVRRDTDEFLGVLLGAPQSGDPERQRQARAAYDAGDIAGASELWPRGPDAERRALSVLAAGRRPGDAYASVAKAMKRLYVAAYQSALFNRLLDRRMDAYDVLWAGDLAVKHVNGAFFLVEDVDTEQPRAMAQEISPSAALFGAKMRQPGGRQRELEDAVLAEEGLTLEDWRLGGGLRLNGDRRPLRVPLEFASVEADDESIGAASGEHSIIVSFSLPSGSYASSVIREITKNDAC